MTASCDPRPERRRLLPRQIVIADDQSDTKRPPANHTQRLVASSDRVLVGATGLYEARCRHCFDPQLATPRKP